MLSYQGIIAFCLFLLFAHRQWKHESSIQSVMIRGVLFAIVLVVLSYIHEDDSLILEGAVDMNCMCLQNCIKGESSIVDQVARGAPSSTKNSSAKTPAPAPAPAPAPEPEPEEPEPVVPNIPTKTWDEISLLFNKRTSDDVISEIDAVYVPEENPDGPEKSPYKWYGFDRKYDGSLHLKPILRSSVETLVNSPKFQQEKSNIPIIPIDLQTKEEHLWIDERYPHLISTAYIGNGLEFGKSYVPHS